MARGTQHRKRRPGADAHRGGVAPQAKPAHGATSSATGKLHHDKPPQWQEQLFFSRLRNHARWLYGLLALLFLLTFVLVGVGSGSNFFQGLFSFGSSTTTADIPKLKAAADAAPKSTKAWRALVTGYETKGATTDAIAALDHLRTLQPKDPTLLDELAGQQRVNVQKLQTEGSSASAVGGLVAQTSDFQLSSSLPLGKAQLGLTDPITSAVNSVASTRAQAAQTKLTAAESALVAAYKQRLALTPKDLNTLFQLGEAAQTAGDTATAKLAYQQFLKIGPTDISAPTVRKLLKSLASSSPSSSSPSSSSSSSGR